MTRHWRFIRRHLLATRASTDAKGCWVHQAAWRERGPDTSPPRLPSSHKAQQERPGRERRRRPPLALRLSRNPPSAGGGAAGPPGPARAAQSVGHVTAQSGPGGPGCRLAERPRSRSGRAELASVECDPGPARARAARSGAGREPGARLPAAAPGAGGATRKWAGPRGRPEKARPWTYRRDKTSHCT